MALVKRHSARPSSGWLQAVIFNAMLVLIPVLAANVVAGVFSLREFPAEPTIESIVETRTEIDQAFRDMTPRGADPRTYWSDLVDRELRARDMAAARGFLLAAPQLLEERDRKAIASASSENASNPRFATEDERLAAAALLFLPNDVRARYETATRPPTLRFERQTARGTKTDTASTDESGPAQRAETAQPAGDDQIRPSAIGGKDAGAAFSVLGRIEDLARNSREWIAADEFGNGARDNGFDLRLTGLGLIADDVLDQPEYNIRQAASLLRSVHRAGRLTSRYQQRLEAGLDAVLPPATLRTRLQAEFEDIAPLSERSDAVAEVFRSTLRADAMGALIGEIAQINRLHDAVGLVAAVGLVEHVQTSADMRRIRLIAEAGGDRAVALEKQLGDDLLDIARTGIKLSRSDVLEIMGLAAAAMAVFWMALAALQRSLVSRRQGFGII